MKLNVGKTDKVLRVIIGLVMIAAGVYFNSWLGAIGAVPLLTALISWCPLYSLLGLSSAR